MSEELREFVRQFGERVERFRILGGWTRDDVAQRAAINPFYLREVELGRRDVSMSTAHRLAKALGTPLRELLGAPPVALSGMGKMWAQEVTNSSPALGDLMVRLLQMGHANQAASARPVEQKASARTPRRKIKAGT